MEKKNTLLLQIITSLLLIAGIVIYAWLLATENPGNEILAYVDPIFHVLTLVGLIAGLVYVLRGYKKNAAAWYKTVIWLTVISAVFSCAICILCNLNSFIIALFVPMSLVTLTVIAVGKDLGKITTSNMAIALLIFRAIITISNVVIGNNALPSILDGIGQNLIAVIIILLVKGKYTDKENRGTV